VNAFSAGRWLLAVLCVGAAGAQAKTYAGFELCAPATPAAVKQVLEAAGGSVARVIEDSYPGEAIVIAKNYPVEGTARSLSVTLYQGQVAYVSVGNVGDMVPGLEARYGSQFTTTRKEEKVGITTNHHYRDPADPQLELTISRFEIAGNKGTFYGVNYACQALYQAMETARKAFAPAEAPQ